jgi:hypothetical protein
MKNILSNYGDIHTFLLTHKLHLTVPLFLFRFKMTYTISSLAFMFILSQLFAIQILSLPLQENPPRLSFNYNTTKILRTPVIPKIKWQIDDPINKSEKFFNVQHTENEKGTNVSNNIANMSALSNSYPGVLDATVLNANESDVDSLPINLSNNDCNSLYFTCELEQLNPNKPQQSRLLKITEKATQIIQKQNLKTLANTTRGKSKNLPRMKTSTFVKKNRKVSIPFILKNILF